MTTMKALSATTQSWTLASTLSDVAISVNDPSHYFLVYVGTSAPSDEMVSDEGMIAGGHHKTISLNP